MKTCITDGLGFWACRGACGKPGSVLAAGAAGQEIPPPRARAGTAAEFIRCRARQARGHAWGGARRPASAPILCTSPPRPARSRASNARRRAAGRPRPGRQAYLLGLLLLATPSCFCTACQKQQERRGDHQAARNHLYGTPDSVTPPQTSLGLSDFVGNRCRCKSFKLFLHR